ncbi:MAG: isoprenylcysteine carboxylmethyltransferase family protein [Pasteurellaceae bacterium]|nr:isoprenylcysteine carboxylmethyltransferase family protein [Pasteurellaceae bacterium]
MELKLPPPFVFLLGAGIIYALPNAFESPLILRGLAVLIAFFALVIDASALLAFRQQRTTISPLTPHNTSSLVTHGIYRFTRNPMYLGLALLLLAWSLWLAQPFGVLVLWGFVAYLNRFQILPEERILLAKFGEAFRQYQTEVPRWISYKGARKT